MKTRLGELASEVYREIHGLTPRQRRAAARVLYGCTSTNCSFTLYALRVALLQFIDERRGRSPFRRHDERH